MGSFRIETFLYVMNTMIYKNKFHINTYMYMCTFIIINNASEIMNSNFNYHHAELLHNDRSELKAEFSLNSVFIRVINIQRFTRYRSYSDPGEGGRGVRTTSSAKI